MSRLLLFEPAGSVPPVRRATKFLQPGQIFVSEAPAAITTILGSCVAVCLWDPWRGVGGMNHFMLPMFAGHGASSARFGNVAMEQLLTQVVAAKGRIGALKAAVFGGGCMFKQMQSPTHLGVQNAELAISFLKERGILIETTNTGGNSGQKLRFHTDEGRTWLTSI